VFFRLTSFELLKPVAMEQTLDLLEEERLALRQDVALPCDAQGRPV
jgi:hypothetical protein